MKPPGKGQGRRSSRGKAKARYVRLKNPETGQDVLVPVSQIYREFCEGSSVSDLLHLDLIVNDLNKLGPQLVRRAQEIWDAVPVVRYLFLVLMFLVSVYYTSVVVIRAAAGGSLLCALESLGIMIMAHMIWVLYKWDGLTSKTKRYVSESVEETVRYSV